MISGIIFVNGEFESIPNVHLGANFLLREIGMNLEHFNVLLSGGYHVWQQPQEWRLFLEFVDTYFKNRKIERPIVVELGTAGNSQKKYYEELLGARHIGINISNKRGESDILGNTHDEGTLGKLKSMLATITKTSNRIMKCMHP